MDNKSVFNATVCIIGIAFLLIHTINIVLKRNRRKDENCLFAFILFTAFHFALYLVFSLIKIDYTSNPFIIAFYTIFYIFNNIEVLFFFIYTIAYIDSNKKSIEILKIVNWSLFAIFIVLDIVNIFNHMFFYAEKGMYVRANTMIISQGYQFVGFASVFFVTMFNRKVHPTEKVAFATYCLLPFVAIILQNALPGYAIAYLSIVLSIEILFLFINVRKNVALANEEKRNKEAEIKIMMSQIQPHFIYNTLASISTLINIDPNKAQKALDDFTEYLRINLSSLTDTSLIPFSDELKHVETYLSLEKVRFDERLNINYDIKVKDFLLPPLSIQPIVENAVKHGILKKIEGGTISIKTYENKDAYVVEVDDDGVGFDPMEVKGNDHIGLNNVKYRLSTMVRGNMVVDSELGKGTTVTVLIYK